MEFDLETGKHQRQAAGKNRLNLANLAPGFVQDMLAVPYTAPESKDASTVGGAMRRFFRDKVLPVFRME